MNIGELLTITVPSVFALVAIYISIRANASVNKIATRDMTYTIFEKWWGKPGDEEIREFRTYFYKIFLVRDLDKARSSNLGLKDIEDSTEEKKSQVRKLCFFFDQVGWLGAAGLINVDYVLGPMEHTMRRVWLIMEPFIMREREKTTAYDPAFQRGFEWLYRYSQKHKQANLFRRKFKKPSLLSKQQTQILDSEIGKNEEEFCKRYDINRTN